MYKGIYKIFQIFNQNGFRVKEMYCDGQFKPLFQKIEDQLGIKINYTNAQDFNRVTERNIWTYKEWIQTEMMQTGYSMLPKIILRELLF